MIISPLRGDFDFRYVSEMRVYLDCHNPAGNGVLPADTTALSSLIDISGLSNDFSQVVGAAQPIYKANQLNGCGVIRLDGAAQYMTCANSANNQYSDNTSVSIFAIAKPVSAPVVPFNQTLIAKGGFPDGGFGAFSDQTTTSAYGFVATNVAQYISTTLTWTTNQFNIYSALFNSSSGVTFYKNGLLASVESIGGSNSNSNAGSLYLGTDQGIARFWPGDIRLLLVYYKLLNPSEVSYIHGGLRAIAGM